MVRTTLAKLVLVAVVFGGAGFGGTVFSLTQSGADHSAVVTVADGGDPSSDPGDSNPWD